MCCKDNNSLIESSKRWFISRRFTIWSKACRFHVTIMRCHFLQCFKWNTLWQLPLELLYLQLHVHAPLTRLFIRIQLVNLQTSGAFETRNVLYFNGGYFIVSCPMHEPDQYFLGGFSQIFPMSNSRIFVCKYRRLPRLKIPLHNSTWLWIIAGVFSCWDIASSAVSYISYSGH